ncbi:chaperonin 10-like protein [Bisporella sp. PMI_857]|nr:chaperonin 10-like protein [Bisporella sp. PMI_857]
MLNSLSTATYNSTSAAIKSLKMANQLPTTMQAITLPSDPKYNFQNPCKAADLSLTSRPFPVPSPSQHLIQIHSVSISPYELTWAGSYPPFHRLPYRIPCHDIAGTIISPPASSPFKPGDRVVAFPHWGGQGGLAEYAAAEASEMAVIPDGIGFGEASSLARAGLTAWQALEVHLGKLGGGVEGRRVLITGATGAVGRVLIQLVRRKIGKGKIVAVGGAGIETLRELGADVALHHREEWADVVKKEGLVDVLFDCIGGPTLIKCWDLLAHSASVITVGTPAPKDLNINNIEGFSEASKTKNVKGLFFILSGNGGQLAQIMSLVKSGDLKSSISLRVPFTENTVRNAWTKGENGGLSGTVVVDVRNGH